MQGGRLVALGDDPAWSRWADWARNAGIPFVRCPWTPGVPLASTAPGVLSAAADQPTVVLVPAGPAPGGHVVAQALTDIGPFQTDAWLVLTRPAPDLQARVLMAGGAGCLPSSPDGRAIARAFALSAWRPPDPQASEPAAAARLRLSPAPARSAGPVPDGVRDAPGAPAGRTEEPRGPRQSGFSGARAGSGTQLLQPAWRWGTGMPSRRRPDARPWWAWPGPSVRTWAVLVPGPAPSEWAAATLAAWREARGRPDSGLLLGSVGRPRRGRPDPRLYVAAAQGAAAVVCPVGRVCHRAARDVVAALRALGAPEVRAWVVRDEGRSPSPLWEWALGVPWARVSLACLQLGPAAGADPGADAERARGEEARAAGTAHGRTG